MEKIAIFGAGGFGREVKFLIDQINKVTPTYELIGFFDDGKEVGQTISGYPVIGGVHEANQYDKKLNLVIAVGDPKIKKTIADAIFNDNISFPNIIHPNVEYDKDSITFGKGNIICSGVILTVDCIIEDFVILNLYCTIGHDCHIGKYSSFMPSVNISGEVTIGESVYMGTGAKIINSRSIGEKTIVGAGASVVKSLPANCTAVGVPAKPIKYHSIINSTKKDQSNNIINNYITNK